VPVDIEPISQRAFEQAFSRTPGQAIQNKAETLFKKAFASRGGIPWEKVKPAFRK